MTAIFLLYLVLPSVISFQWLSIACDRSVRITTTRATTAAGEDQSNHNVVTILNDATVAAGQRKFMHMTSEQDELLRQKGELEADLMRPNSAVLKPTIVKRRVSGFGHTSVVGNINKNKSSQRSRSTTPKGGRSSGGNIHQGDTAEEMIPAFAKILKNDGIVRIDNVLPDELADNLKEYLVDLRVRSTLAVERGEVMSYERFADVLLNQNRCDLKIPLGPPSVNQALYHLLCRTIVGPLVEHIFDSTAKDTQQQQHRHHGGNAQLYELNCFMSNSGARRQLVHADNVCVEPGVLPDDEPVMLTAFVALQDIDEQMGPTIWLLGTNNRAAHEQFYGDKKEYILKNSKKVVGCLPKGACAVFDPRTLHCAGANISLDPASTRALFYVSFKNSAVDDPGCPTCSGYGIADSHFTLNELRTELAKQIEMKEVSTRLDFASSFP